MMNVVYLSQAGEKHYHPQCSRCAKCGQMFGEGEEMYLQGKCLCVLSDKSSTRDCFTRSHVMSCL